MGRRLLLLVPVLAACSGAPAARPAAELPLPSGHRALRLGMNWEQLQAAHPASKAERFGSGTGLVTLPAASEGPLTFIQQGIMKDDALTGVMMMAFVQDLKGVSRAAHEEQQRVLLERCRALYGGEGTGRVPMRFKDPGPGAARRYWRMGELEALLELPAYQEGSVLTHAGAFVINRRPRGNAEPAPEPSRADKAAQAARSFFKGDFPDANAPAGRVPSAAAPASADPWALCARNGGAWTDTKEKWPDPRETRSGLQCLRPEGLERYRACAKGSWDPQTSTCSATAAAP